MPFDKVKYNELIAQSKYGEAADMLEGLQFNDRDAALKNKYYVEKLRKSQKIEDAVKERIIDPTDISAYNFTNNIKNGYVDTEDPIYGQRYRDALKEVGSIKGTTATGLSITMSTPIYKSFLQNGNFKDTDFLQLGIDKRSTKDGKINISIDKSNSEFYRIMNAIDGAYNDNRASFTMPTMFAPYDITVKPDVEALSIRGTAYGNNTKFAFGKEKSYDNSLKGVYDIIQEAANRKVKAVERTKNNIEYVQSTILSDYLGLSEEKLLNQLKRGEIEATYFNNELDKLKDTRRLSIISAINNPDIPVYGTIPGDNESNLAVLSKKDRDIVRSVLSQRDAFKDDNVKLRAAIRGGQLGTYIEIAGKPKEDGTVVTNKTNVNSARTLFVPNTLSEQEAEIFDRNTKTKAMREADDCAKFNISYDMDDGRYIKDVTNNSAVLVDNNGNEIEITKDQALSEINKDIIIKRSIANLEQIIYDRNNRPKTDDYTRSLVSNWLNVISGQAVKDIYGYNIANSDGSIKEDDGSLNYLKGIEYFTEIRDYISKAIKFDDIFKN